MSSVVPIQTAQPIAPRDYSGSQLALIKRTVAKDCNGDEFDLFIEVCRRVGLDPFRKQIYALVFNKDKADKRQLTMITGIDGYRAVAARNGDYRPDDRPPRITYEDAAKDAVTNPLGIIRAEVSAYRRVDGEWHEIAGEAYWEEFAPIEEEVKWVDTGETWEDSGKAKKVREGTGKFTLAKDSWKRMGRVMIAKCAEAQALRKGWPEDLSGFYAEEEMHQAMAADMTATQAAESAETERRLIATRTKDTVPILWNAGESIHFIPAGQVADKVMEHIRTYDSATGLRWWTETNREGLRQFWALAKSDALECKAAIEKRLVDLDAEATPTKEPALGV